MPTINLHSLKESDVQNTSSHQELKEGFRVRVCLERYFSDERSRAYVSVIRHRPVRWLQEHLRSLFDLKGLFCLCSNGYFLPGEEPLSILLPNDPVEVIPLTRELINSASDRQSSSGIHLLSNESATLNYSAETIDQEVVGLKEGEDIKLLCMKQQALELLETCKGTACAEFDSCQPVFGAVESDKPRRSRRRVRRRKRQLSSEDSNWSMRENEKKKGIQNFENNTHTPTGEKAVASDMVNMFGDDRDKATGSDELMGLRKARLVHSISTSQTQGYK